MRNRESRDITQPRAHTSSPITSFRALSALPFSCENFHFSSTVPREMKHDLLRSYDSVPVLNFMRIRPARGAKKKERGERKKGNARGILLNF